MVILTAGNILPLAASLVTAPILAHALGAVGRGELAAAVAPLILAAAGLTLGVPEAITFFTARGQSGFWRSMLFGCALVVPAGALGVVVIFLSAPALAAGDSVVSSLIGLAALALPLTLVVYCIRGYARGRQAWSLVALEQGVNALFRIVLIGSLAMLSVLSVSTATFITAVAGIIGVLAYIPLAWRRTNRSEQVEVQRVDGKSFAAYGGAVWIGAAAGILLAKLDVLLILPLSNAYELGVYVVAVSLADVIRVFNMAVRDVVFSSQAKATDDEALARACRVSNGVTFAFGVLMTGLCVPLVPFVFGNEFRPSVPVLAVLVVGVVLGNPGSVMAAGLTARGRPILRSIALLLGLLLNIALVTILVPKAGAMGAAVASACANFAVGMVILAMGRSIFGLKITNHILPRRSDLTYLKGAVRSMLNKRKAKEEETA